jgi:DNA-binding NarL/FixJ family response regulator
MPIDCVKVAIVDDHLLFRTTLKSCLSDQPNLQVVVQANDVQSLLDQLRSSPADVLLMDLFLPGVNGREAAALIRSAYPELRILVLSVSLDVEMVAELLEEGVSAFIAKSDEPEELLKAIHSIASDGLYRNDLLTETLYQTRQKISKCVAEAQVELSDREKRILQLIWEEKSNKEIADELFLGVRSVEKLRQTIKEKVGAKSTVGLLKYGFAKKIIQSVWSCQPVSEERRLLNVSN